MGSTKLTLPSGAGNLSAPVTRSIFVNEAQNKLSTLAHLHYVKKLFAKLQVCAHASLAKNVENFLFKNLEGSGPQEQLSESLQHAGFKFVR